MSYTDTAMEAPETEVQGTRGMRPFILSRLSADDRQGIKTFAVSQSWE